MQEEELRLKQQQEEARLRLEQGKQQLQLQTEIAKMEAEEQMYAVAEQGVNYVRQPFPVRTQDLSSFSSPPQPRPSALGALDQFSESVQATQGFINVPQEPRRSEELQPIPAVTNPPGSKLNILSPQGTPWSPEPSSMVNPSSVTAAQIMTVLNKSKAHLQVLQTLGKNSCEI